MQPRLNIFYSNVDFANLHWRLGENFRAKFNFWNFFLFYLLSTLLSQRGLPTRLVKGDIDNMEELLTRRKVREESVSNVLGSLESDHNQGYIRLV